MTDKIADAERILTESYNRWKPSWIFCLYSGGYDSLCATHITVAWANRLGIADRVKVISLDTNVSADGWRDYVMTVAESLGWNHEIWMNPNPDFYYENSKQYGMPYTKLMHGTVIYRNLKEKTLDKVRSSYKTAHRDRCMLVSGMRREESLQRATTPEQLEDGAGLWVAPLVEWTSSDALHYRTDNALPENPFYETLGGSGDCYCNWHCNNTLAQLWKHSPNLASRIEPVHNYCLEHHGWGYGERPSNALIAERRGQLTLPGVEPLVSLCASCERPKPDATKATDWRELQGDWE